MKYPSCKKQHIIFYCVMADVLLRARHQDLAVFLRYRFDFNNKRLGLAQQFLGDTPNLFRQQVRKLSRANVSDCGKA